jgi:secreted Zn-dependent insulinase-like peptidase
VLKQSPNDFKKYRTITLGNGLRVLLIHNENATKSAAALAVNAGHFNDPKDRQGLAHFLEHLLFLGTEKYPDGSEYQKFISQHGGHHNAWTATEHTCFFFDIQESFFSEALDRFSQFFISPLLSIEKIDDERKNIDAEFKLKLKDDIRRLYDVHKETINPEHPFSQFSVGTSQTLADREGSSIQEEAFQFFNQHYHASKMTLAIEGSQSLDALEHLVRDNFSAIKTTNSHFNFKDTPLYLTSNQAIKINVQPVKSERQLIVSFAMESIDKYYLDKPESIIAYLLGHEGKGSILSYLKKQQWGMALTAGSGINGYNFKDFNISVTLTELGEQNIAEIVEVIFSYINLLMLAPLPDFYYQEKSAISKLAFTYHEKMRPLDNVSQLVINMQHYPCDDYIFGDFVMSGHNQTNIDKLLSYFTPDNMRLIHISQNNHFDKTSHWYQVPYSVDNIDQRQLEKWCNPASLESLSLPLKNPYIYENVKVYPDESQVEHLSSQDNLSNIPLKIVDEDGLVVWYKQDTTFKVPKGYLYLGIDCKNAIDSVENIAMTKLFSELYCDNVIEENYDAELAGIHYYLYPHQGGVTLQLSGLSEMQPALLAKLLQSLMNHQVTQVRFDLLKKQLINQWHNSKQSKSIPKFFSKLSTLLQPNNPNVLALADALDSITFEKYMLFTKQLFNEVYLEALIHGNWLQKHGDDIVKTIKNAFIARYNQGNAVKCPVVDIQNKGRTLYGITLDDSDNASVIYTPLPTRDNTSIALTMVTSHLLSPLFFQKMRTEKQYGYLVGVGYVPINRFPGIAFYIQSPHTNSTKLVEAMDQFINDSLIELADIPDEAWQQIKQGLAGQLQEKDQSLRIKSQRFWAAICNNDDDFIHKEQLINEILLLEVDQVRDFIINKLATKNLTREGVSIPREGEGAVKSVDSVILVSSHLATNNLAEVAQKIQAVIIKDESAFTHKSKLKY